MCIPHSGVRKSHLSDVLHPVGCETADMFTLIHSFNNQNVLLMLSSTLFKSYMSLNPTVYILTKYGPL